jgi:hypothetical protein
MKITTPKGYVIELTTDEAEALFPELVHDLRRQLGGPGHDHGPGHRHGPGDDRDQSPQRLVRRVLRRHRIPPTQRALYRALYEAGDDGLDFGSLAATVGRSAEELSGVLGGLGRRVNATPGIGALPEPPGVTLLFEQKPSAPPGGGWGWAMRPELRAALEEMGLPWEE